MKLSLWSFNDKLYRSMGISYMLYKPCVDKKYQFIYRGVGVQSSRPHTQLVLH